MFRLILAILVTLVVGHGAVAVAQQPLAAGSVWVNQLGSTMTINSFGANGLITGSYVTAVGCGAGTQRPLTGWYNGGATTFTVNFQECNSATSWTGNFGPQGISIVTLWQLAVSGEPTWESILAGADTFKPQ